MQPENDDLIPIEPAPIDDPVPESPVPEKRPFWGYVDLALLVGLLLAFVAAIFLGAAGLVFSLPSLRQDQAQLLLPTQIALYAAVYVSFRVVFGLRHGRPVLSSLGWCPARF